VEEASDGNEAIEKTNSRKPQIILMDLQMPGMDGIEATRILRSAFAKVSLTIIGISASAFETEKQHFLAAGVNAYIAKPFREQELYEVLARHAGVLFEIEEHEESLTTQQNAEIPTLEKMPPEWCEAFRQALVRKNITRLRKLGEEAKAIDPILSSWLLERAGLYDLSGLRKLSEGHE